MKKEFIENAEELTQYVRSLRHNMHICDSAADYSQLLEDISSEFHNFKKYDCKVPKLHPINLDDCCCDDDECWGDCDKCKELEREELGRIKEENNTIIEEWMKEVDEECNTNICPSGMARIIRSENI